MTTAIMMTMVVTIADVVIAEMTIAIMKYIMLVVPTHLTLTLAQGVVVTHAAKATQTTDII